MYTVMHPGAEGLYAVLPRFINGGSTNHEASQRASAPQIPPDTPALLHCSHQKAGALGGGVWGHATLGPTRSGVLWHVPLPCSGVVAR